MTLDEAIKWYKDKETEYKYLSKEHEDFTMMAEQYHQFVEWLRELKDLREENKVLTSECDRLIKEKGELLKKSEQIAEYKRLLKAAVEDINNSVNDVHCKYCSKWHTDQCQGTSHLDCYIENKFKWRYADEALALIGEDGEQNG